MPLLLVVALSLERERMRVYTDLSAGYDESKDMVGPIVALLDICIDFKC
jgi:hypothetical protein